jgi:hypothetical protein
MAVWMLVMCVHILLLLLTEKLPWVTAVTDALVSNVLFAAIGLGLWFPVFFSRTESKRLLNFLINHISACSVTLVIWISLLYFMLFSAFSDQEAYLEFLRRSIPWRAGIGVLYYGMMIVVYFLIIYGKSVRENMVKESELKALVKESELNSLKSQINPHFLFNSLNSISSLTMIEPAKAQEMIIKLSEFLRYSISIKVENMTPLREEIGNINRYLDIEKIRFGKRLSVKVTGSGDCMELKLPGMILQPLVENAIKYGVYESTEESLLEIQCSCNNAALFITIINAYDPDYLYKKGEGIGLRNIRSRMKLIYSRDDLMQISKNARQHEVRIIFPQQ